MSSRYDSRTTTFSPEGRLYQVEYASDAISKAPPALGIVTKEGIVLATQRSTRDKLMDDEGRPEKDISGDKLFKIANHIGIAAAGLGSDALRLVKSMRETAARHEFNHRCDIPIEELTRLVCDLKHGYTQYGGVRPFGVAFLIAGFDKYNGFQLYQTDPSGNYTAWLAYAVGEGDGVAMSLLKQHHSETMTLKEAQLLALKILQRTMDVTNLTADRVEIGTITRAPLELRQRMRDDILEPHEHHPTTVPRWHILRPEELEPLIAEAEEIRKREQEEEERRERMRDQNNDEDDV